MSTLVLLVTHDQALTERVKSVLDSHEDALSIVFVDRLLSGNGIGHGNFDRPHCAPPNSGYPPRAVARLARKNDSSTGENMT
jgi:hypothetical protein